MKILRSIFWELLEEQCEEGINVLAGGDGITDRATAVGEADINGLIEEDDRSIGVPRVWIVNEFQVFIDTGWT